MVHTFEITTPISDEVAQQIIKNHLTAEQKRRLDEENYCEVVNPLNVPGIASFYINQNPMQGYSVMVKVEPQSLIKGQLTMEVFNCSVEDRTTLKESLERHLAALFVQVPSSLEEWSLSRIDYAMNLKSDQVKHLVELAKKGKDPYRYEDTVREVGSSYRQSKSVRLNFYDKYDQLSKQEDLVQRHPNLLDEAMNVFRIEVQCREWSKLRNIRNKFSLSKAAGIMDYLQPHIAQNIIEYYYGAVIGKGDYYSMKEAEKKIVAQTQWNKRKKNNLINCLKLIAQARNISKAREQFREGAKLKNTTVNVQGSDGSFNSYIRICHEIGINPVTIPREWRVSFISNPVKVG